MGSSSQLNHLDCHLVTRVRMELCVTATFSVSEFDGMTEEPQMTDDLKERYNMNMLAFIYIS